MILRKIDVRADALCALRFLRGPLLKFVLYCGYAHVSAVKDDLDGRSVLREAVKNAKGKNFLWTGV